MYLSLVLVNSLVRHPLRMIIIGGVLALEVRVKSGGGLELAVLGQIAIVLSVLLVQPHQVRRVSLASGVGDRRLVELVLAVVQT